MNYMQVALETQLIAGHKKVRFATFMKWWGLCESRTTRVESLIWECSGRTSGQGRSVACLPWLASLKIMDARQIHMTARPKQIYG